MDKQLNSVKLDMNQSEDGKEGDIISTSHNINYNHETAQLFCCLLREFNKIYLRKITLMAWTKAYIFSFKTIVHIATL
jgi:hypothetical protein